MRRVEPGIGVLQPACFPRRPVPLHKILLLPPGEGASELRGALIHVDRRLCRDPGVFLGGEKLRHRPRIAAAGLTVNWATGICCYVQQVMPDQTHRTLFADQLSSGMPRPIIPRWARRSVSTAVR
jgi:hypothetical protein